ncbi:MAG TPA: ATP-binding protein [Lichenihabitans sp.]|nr:ATP-binding protein [Lichenihabitans sp.]
MRGGRSRLGRLFDRRPTSALGGHKQPGGTWLATRSIALRLFLSSVFWSSLILLLAGLTLSAINRRSAEADFDERLSVYLKALAADVAGPGEESRINPGQLGEPMFDFPLSGWYWQITRLDVPSDDDVKASRSLFAERLPPLAGPGNSADAGGPQKGYITGPDDRRLRIVERTIDNGNNGRFLIQVAASPEEVEIDIDTFNVALFLTFSLLALALVASTALQVRFGLRPLRRLGAGVTAIRRGDGERIEGRFPPEIAPLANELNLLMASNREIVDRARTHVGNLAHALKTPLSVILNEAPAQGDPRDAEALAAKVRDQAGIMRDQVTYYLDRARAAARSSVIGTAADVTPVIDGLVRTFGKIYRDRRVTFEAAVPEGLRFRGEKQDLEDLVGNLVDNAGKWAASRVWVTVVALTEPGDQAPSAIEITVDDDGPGLSEEARSLVMARGRRLDESKPGSGLGLSIVTDLAGIYAGSFRLARSPQGGLRAVLRLPGSRTEFRPNPM